ncbi:hypothetical protein GGR53DRAFT_528192 [Hypoxylon sp. FL1150]|nr:hypothetical protein GGR53DRAFT_528192 [Hypoxylon sp. FL1150]
MISRNALPRAICRTRQLLPSRRTYADERPPLSHGGNNRPIIIALVAVTIPGLTWFFMRKDKPITPSSVSSPDLDPAERIRSRRENESDTPRPIHPEHEDPELKAPFGVVHKRKRVDGPPDDRNHASLSERNKSKAQSADVSQ